MPSYEKLLFLNSTQSKNYYLSGQPTKDSDFAYFLNKTYQEKTRSEIDINIVSDVSETTIPYQKVIETQAELNIKVEDYFFEDLKSFINNQKQDTFTENTNQVKVIFFKKIFLKVKKKVHKNIEGEPKEKLQLWALKKIEHFAFKIIFAAIFVFFISSFLFVGSAYYTLKSLESAVFNLKKGDLIKTSQNHQKAKISMSVVNANFQITHPILNLFSKNLGNKSHNIANFLDFTLTTFDGIVQSFVLSEKIYNSLNSPHSLDYNSTLLAIKSNLQQVYESLNQMEILLDGLDLPKPIYEAIKQNTEYEHLKKTKENLWGTNKLIDVVAPLLGSDKNTNVYILVQNQNELRPTGGVIELIYHLSIDKGRIVFLKSFIPQEIERLSDLSIDPPPLVGKLTGENVWKLKDMNYNPDFSQTATNISWFLENKLKTKADFVIGLNIKVLDSLLVNKKLKPFLETDLTYEQFVADNQSGNSSAQIKILMDKLLDNVLNHKFPLTDLFEMVAKNKENYNFWVSDPVLQSQIFNLPVAKNINQKDCLPAISTSRKCIPQTIHLNLSNFSSIPLNGYLERELKIVSTPQVLTVDHEIVLNSKYLKPTPLINRNLTEIVQLYVSKNSTLNSIELNGEKIEISQVLSQVEKDMIRFQFIISTPLNKEYSLSIKYSNQLSERTILPIAYSYNIIPQNGLEYKKQTIEFNLPESSRVSAITRKIESLPNKIVVDLKDIDSFGYNLVGK
ncbi:hypothetical protein A2572_00730 [Candidatus Collierbacteria bacterium RIFOXYD1_FULL_40_9]|uniref:DUF4012 domain-containing protein n=1 Tax=Candidatus Collierbacteria bacterium RIFOXYD1_FULL_40_9 TaxID=1817731 RepID=A0A1F5FVU5_9BACT|nr:MAG: hypothetical protein A2572_00730 [Candidatus Collierbacteria bacterium RIFOXYD1_FULL_40_9]